MVLECDIEGNGLGSAIPLVQLRDIRVHFYNRKGLFGTTAVRALDGVSLDIARGETVAVVGESGSGKTTLGRASLRLVKTTGGVVVFGGTDITRLPEGQLRWFRRSAQAIFQDPFSSINPYMNILELVEEPLIIHGLGSRHDRREQVVRVLDEVGLSPGGDFLRKYPHMVSGGQLQRVGVARALVLEPDYIVADEPASMIDASSRAEILYLLRDLQKRRGIAFLYITHDIASARHFSDRIAVMYLGTLVELGASNNVIDQPLHPYTQALIEAVPEADPANRFRQRRVIPGEAPNPSQIPSGCPFHPRCSHFMKGVCDERRPVLQQITSEAIQVACHIYPME